MKRVFLLLIVALFSQEIYSCDICGCSSGNYFIGPLPQFNKHFFGMRYSFRSFKSVSSADESEYSNDLYQTLDLWGGIVINKKWQLLTFIPYNINYSTSDDGIKRNNGLGDISLIVNYNLLDKKAVTKQLETFSQQLWIGGGIKLATGQFAPDSNELTSSVNNQTGTGSTDFLLNASYIIQIKQWGLSANLNYKMNQSREDFKFGNKLNTSAFVSHSIHLSSTTLNPNIGLMYEHLDKNVFNKIEVDQTGGNALLGAIGLESRFGNLLNLGCNVQLPIDQNISDGQTQIKVRGMLHISYSF